MSLIRFQSLTARLLSLVLLTTSAMQQGTLKGVLWHQGESDSGREATAASYGERLAGMVKDLRAELGAGDVPFVAGELGRYLARADKDCKPSFWPLVNEQIVALPKTVPNSAIASSEGLKAKSDNVHFDSASLRKFGRRYAKAMQGLKDK